jgi:hypothetical protein
MLTVAYAECHIQAAYAECSYAECHYTECRYGECRGAMDKHSSLFCATVSDKKNKFITGSSVTVLSLGGCLYQLILLTAV